MRLHPHQNFPSQYCIHHTPIVENPLNYCTMNSQQPQYEEIGSMYLPASYAPHYAANPICCDTNNHGLLQRQDSDTIFEDLSENLRRQERKPPPISRPPPPPPSNFVRHYQQVQQQRPHNNLQSESGSSITDELGSGSDMELEQLAQIGVPLPIEVMNTRQQSAHDLHGRESGYDTGSKRRMQSNWHSPPQLLRAGRLVILKIYFNNFIVLVMFGRRCKVQVVGIPLNTTLLQLQQMRQFHQIVPLSRTTILRQINKT